MTVFVTGGAGFIGSAVVRDLISDGETVVTIDKLTYAGSLENLTKIEGNSRHHFEQVDICDMAAIKGLFAKYQPTAVYHLAAESHVDRSIDGPGDFIQTNLVGTFIMLQAALEYWRELESAELCDQFRFLHVSTDEVYGELGAEGLFSETSAYEPSSPYSASKAGSDHLARAWQRTYGLPVIVTNCSNNYGPYQFPEKLLPVVILNALAGRELPVYGTGENIRDWLYVDDHSRALRLVVQKGRVGETYMIGGRAERTNIDMVRSLCRILDDHHPEDAPHENLITFVTDRPGHDARYAVDCSKIERELGWTQSVTLEEGLAETVRWYLRNLNWVGAVGKGAEQARRGLDGDDS